MSDPVAPSLPTDAELVQALHLITARVAGGAAPAPLLALRARLAAEMVGDTEAVAATLADGFELLTRTASTSTTTGRDAMLQNLGRMAAVGTMMWIELEDLVSDPVAVAGHGVMKILLPTGDDLLLTTAPIALFLRFDGDLMTSETVYFDAAAGSTTTLPATPMPAAAYLRTLLDGAAGTP